MDIIRCETGGQVIQAIGMGARDAVGQAKHFTAAGREQQIVFAHRIIHDGEHGIAEVGVKHITGCQINFFTIVNGAPGRKVFIPVAARKTRQVRHLFSLYIYDADMLVPLNGERRAGLRRYAVVRDRQSWSILFHFNKIYGALIISRAFPASF